MTDRITAIVLQEISDLLGNGVVVTPRMHLKEDLGMPSIKLVLFLTRVSAQLDLDMMDFGDHEILRLKTVNDVIELLHTKTK
ncbi:MAG: phosphopantetheine-binding protein [Ginsengibacter sp.]